MPNLLKHAEVASRPHQGRLSDEANIAPNVHGRSSWHHRATSHSVRRQSKSLGPGDVTHGDWLHTPPATCQVTGQFDAIWQCTLSQFEPCQCHVNVTLQYLSYTSYTYSYIVCNVTLLHNPSSNSVASFCSRHFGSLYPAASLQVLLTLHQFGWCQGQG